MVKAKYFWWFLYIDCLDTIEDDQELALGRLVYGPYSSRVEAQQARASCPSGDILQIEQLDRATLEKAVDYYVHRAYDVQWVRPCDSLEDICKRAALQAAVVATFEDLMKDFGGTGLRFSFLDRFFGDHLRGRSFTFRTLSTRSASGFPAGIKRVTRALTGFLDTLVGRHSDGE